MCSPSDGVSPLIDRGEYETPPRSGGLPLIQYLVANRQYDLTEEAYERWSNGEFELLDLEHAILHGTVKKKEVDEKQESVGNAKYTIIGKDTHGYDFYCCGKVVHAESGRLYLVITAHSAN